MSGGLNICAVVFAFSCILGSPFSQRARAALAYVGIPTLCFFSVFKVMKPNYDLVEELTFYASYHAEPRNQLIHVIFVPLLVATAMVWLAYVPSPFGKATLFTQGPINFWQFMAASAWSAHWIHASPVRPHIEVARLLGWTASLSRARPPGLHAGLLSALTRLWACRHRMLACSSRCSPS